MGTWDHSILVDSKDDFDPVKVKELFSKIRNEFPEDSDWEKVVSNIRAAKFKDRLNDFIKKFIILKNTYNTVLLFPEDWSEVIICTTKLNNITEKVATKYNKCELKVGEANFSKGALQKIVMDLFNSNNEKWGDFYYCLYAYEDREADYSSLESCREDDKSPFNYIDRHVDSPKSGVKNEYRLLDAVNYLLDRFREEE